LNLTADSNHILSTLLKTMGSIKILWLSCNQSVVVNNLVKRQRYKIKLRQVKRKLALSLWLF